MLSMHSSSASVKRRACEGFPRPEFLPQSSRERRIQSRIYNLLTRKKIQTAKARRAKAIEREAGLKAGGLQRVSRSGGRLQKILKLVKTNNENEESKSRYSN